MTRIPIIEINDLPENGEYYVHLKVDEDKNRVFFKLLDDENREQWVKDVDWYLGSCDSAKRIYDFRGTKLVTLKSKSCNNCFLRPIKNFSCSERSMAEAKLPSCSYPEPIIFVELKENDHDR